MAASPKKTITKSRTTWLVHYQAQCETCGKHFGARNAQALAARHAKMLKHKVTGELGFAFEYDGTKE